MTSIKMILAIAFLTLSLVSQPAGVAGRYLAASVHKSAVIPFGPPDASTIGCGSVLAGFILPACPSTIDGLTSTRHATPITELPIGGDGFGSTPTPVFNNPATSSSISTIGSSTATPAAIITNPTTVTATLPPVTFTRTVSEVISNFMTTATALCFVGDSGDDILSECTKTLQGPIATASLKSAAIPAAAANPIKSLTGSKLWTIVFGDQSIGSSPRQVDHRISRRAVNSVCVYDIAAFVFGGVGTIIFIWILVAGCRKWRTGKDIPVWPQVKGYFFLAAVAWLFAMALS